MNRKTRNHSKHGRIKTKSQCHYATREFGPIFRAYEFEREVQFDYKIYAFSLKTAIKLDFLYPIP